MINHQNSKSQKQNSKRMKDFEERMIDQTKRLEESIKNHPKLSQRDLFLREVLHGGK